MADYLPEGVIVNILQRLSVKNLICCTCVSKSWYSLITSPEFISSHLNFTSATEKDASLLLLRRCHGDSECYSLYTDEIFCTWNDTLKFPFTSINSYFTIIGNCNGLLCLSDDRVLYLHTIILWNPCIRKSIVLPKPNLIYNSFGTFVQSFGFGFDPISSDYKLVRITYVDDAQEPLPQVEIYRLSTDLWQDISYLALDCVIYNRSRAAYINGATHWIASSIQHGDLIVSFDMCREVFRKMTIPASLVNLESFSSKDVVAYKGSLALISWNLSGNDPGFCVWVMKEYGVAESWAKHFVMTYQNARGGIMRPLWVRRNGGILVARQDGRVVSYDVVGDGVEVLRIRGSSSEEFVRSVHVDGYMESLVLLGRRGPEFDDAHVRNILPLLNFGDGCGSSVNSYGCCYLRSLGNGFKHSHGSYAAHGTM